MWRRYRMPLIAAVPAGAAFGGLVMTATYLTGNADYRAFGGWNGFWAVLWPGLLLGGAVGLSAAAGAVIAVLARDRRLLLPRGARVRAAALGAALGAVAFWLALGTISGFMSAGGAFVAVIGSVLSAPAAAGVAGWLLWDADVRATVHRRAMTD